MTEYKLFNLIGAFMFAGIALLVFIQTDRVAYRIESGLFFLTIGIVYFVLLNIFYKKRELFNPVMFVLALLSVALIFVQLFFFGKAY